MDDKNLKLQQEETLRKMEAEIGAKGLVGSPIPILGNVKMKKATALGKWVVFVFSKQKEKSDSGILWLPEANESAGHLIVESVGPETTKVKVGDVVLAPGIHAEKDNETGQLWAMCHEDVIVCIMEEV